MKWSEFKQMVEATLSTAGLDDAPIAWIDVDAPVGDAPRGWGWGKPQARVANGELIVET